CGQFPPLSFGELGSRWIAAECPLDFLKGNARALGYLDHGDVAQHDRGEPALVAGVARAGDQSLRLVEVDGGNRHARAMRHLPYREQARKIDRLLRLHGLTSTLLEVL